jgi:hypothetical protein
MASLLYSSLTLNQARLPHKLALSNASIEHHTLFIEEKNKGKCKGRTDKPVESCHRE